MTRRITRTLVANVVTFVSLVMVVNVTAYADDTSGKWGQANYTWNQMTQTLTVEGAEVGADPHVLGENGTQPWFGVDVAIEEVEHIVLTNASGLEFPKDSSFLFAGLANTVDVKGIEDVEVSNVTNMQSMFQGAASLTQLDFSEWDVGEVDSMENMFFGTSSLFVLDLSTLDTSNVATMKDIFSGSGVQILNLGEKTQLPNDTKLWDGPEGKDARWWQRVNKFEFVSVGDAERLVDLTNSEDFEGCGFTLRWKHRLTFDLNGGMGPVPEDPVEVLAWEVYRVNDVAPHRGRFQFLGWELHKESDLIVPGGSFMMPNTDSVLQAQWQRIDPVVVRFGGGNRYETNNKINEKTGTRGTSVFLATGDDYADALSVAPVAADLDGNLFLSPSNNISLKILAEIKVLHPKEVFIVGGTKAISKSVESLVQWVTGVIPVRFDGADRYETSKEIYHRFFDGKGIDTALVATGTDYADALSASASAGALGGPVILVDGTNATSLDSNLMRSLKKKTENMLIVGGTKAVNQTIEDSLKETFGNVIRTAGKNRWETNMFVNDFLNERFGVDNLSYIWVATGWNFPDALSAAVPAGNYTARVVLSEGKCIPAPVVTDWVRGKESVVERVNLVGGTEVLNAEVNALTECK